MRISATLWCSVRRAIREMPGPPSWPLLGNSHFFRTNGRRVDNYHQSLLELNEKYGDLVLETRPLGGGHVVHVFHPEDAKKVLLADGKKPRIVPLQETTRKYREMRGMNPGMGNLNGDEWYRLRSAVQQAMMRPDAVHIYLPMVDLVARDLGDHIQAELNDKQEVDMRAIVGRWSLESAGLIDFERRLGSFTHRKEWADRLVSCNLDIFRLSAKLKFAILPIYDKLHTPAWRRMVQLEDEFYGETDALMTEAIERLKKQDDNRELLFASYLVRQPQLSERDVKVVLLSLFADGLSTTAPMLLFNLYNLARNPDCQAEARKQIDEHVPSDDVATPQQLARLTYLKACIKETFRLFPIGTEISRITQREVELGDFDIPVGTPVDINTNILLRSERNFDRPSEFIPARWTRRDQQLQHPFSFLPFGHGPRMCAGRRFAEQDLQCVLARLLQRFEIGYSGLMTQRYETLLLPDGHCRFTFRSRQRPQAL